MSTPESIRQFRQDERRQREVSKKEKRANRRAKKARKGKLKKTLGKSGPTTVLVDAYLKTICHFKCRFAFRFTVGLGHHCFNN